MQALLLMAGPLLRLISWLPLRWLHGLAIPLGLLTRITPWKKHRVIAVNLALCFPDLDPAERERLHRQHLVELWRGLFEAGALWHWSAERIERHLDWPNSLALRQANASQPVMVITGHLGNWELLNTVVGQQVKLATLYRQPQNPALDQFITAPRERFGNRMVAGGGPAMRQLLAQLRADDAVGIAADIQPKRGDGVHVPLFGQPALTMTLANRLARKTGAAVFYAWAERLPRGQGWTIHLERAGEAITDDDPAVALADMNRWLESAIRQAPAQYLWIYKRFSRQPDGRRLYAKSVSDKA
ncbi:MAG: lysophospholipid acyltransferase family protein [Wenzhouxiangella sp.]